MFNEYQQDAMRDLALMPPSAKCWCGWYAVGKCPNCDQNPMLKGKSQAARQLWKCLDCGAVPDAPGTAPRHSVSCSRRLDR